MSLQEPLSSDSTVIDAAVTPGNGHVAKGHHCILMEADDTRNKTVLLYGDCHQIVGGKALDFFCQSGNGPS